VVFKWYHIGGETPVEIDSFDGRKIRYGGLKFEGSPQLVYWNALSAYVKKKLKEIYSDLEAELKTTPEKLRHDMIVEVTVLCKDFNARILQKADQTENLLLKKEKARGVNYYEYKCEASKFSLIEQYKDSLIAKYEIGKKINIAERFELLASKYPVIISGVIITLLVGASLVMLSSRFK